MGPMVTIRTARPADVPQILEFIRGLGEYERLTSEVIATEAALHATLFGERPYAEVLMAECDARPAGFRAVLPQLFDFLAQPGSILRICSSSRHSESGVSARRSSRQLAQLALARGCARLEWSASNGTAWRSTSTCSSAPRSWTRGVSIGLPARAWPDWPARGAPCPVKGRRRRSRASRSLRRRILIISTPTENAMAKYR